jgi:hypothetical protein
VPVRLLPGVVALFAVFGAAAPAAAAKVDLVVLENGDRVTCEIKGLDRGRLTLGTDAFDTIHVYWSRIVRLASPREFEVERSGGQRFYGTLIELPERRVRVEAGGAGIDLPLEDVVRITPIEAGFWQRTDGHIDVGFNFNKASLETRWSLNADARHRTRRYDGKLVLASQSTRREDAEPLQRNSVSLVGNRFVGTRWSAIAVGQVQQNQELSLDLRTVVGAGVGHYVAQSNRTTLQVYSGLAYTRERFSDAAAQNRAEAVAGGNWAGSAPGTTTST